MRYVNQQAELPKVISDLAMDGVLYVDMEASGLDPHTSIPWLFTVKCAREIYIIDLRKVNIYPMKELLESRTLVGHNIAYDLGLLKAMNIVPSKVYCTMMAESVLTMGKGLKVDLASVCERRLGRVIDKSFRESFIMDPAEARKYIADWSNDLLVYSARDVDFLQDIMESQRQEGLYKVIELENNLVPVTVNMSYTGVQIDIDRWLRLYAQNKIALSEAHVKACMALRAEPEYSLFSDEVRYDSVNLSSVPTVKRLLSNLGIELEKTDRETLQTVDHPAVEALLEYRTLAKELSSYGSNWREYINPVTGRIHSSFRQIGCQTGRYSGTAPSLQTIPANPEYRECFVATPGNVLVYADYDSIEMRILATVSKCQSLSEAFEKGEDVHARTASIMLGVSLEECGKGTRNREIGKTLNYSIIYGQGAEKLSKSLSVTVDEASKLIERYFSTLPEIKKWQSDSLEFTQENKYAETILGRRRYFIEGDEKAMRATAINMPIQGTSADITKSAMVAMHKRAPFIINTVHDEIIAECPEGIKDEVLEVIETSMVESARAFGIEATVSIKSGSHWSK